jgi:hypothetical protein
VPPSAPYPDQRPPALPESVLAIVAATIWLLLLAPPPDYFLHSAETGHQLAGAWNLLHFGQWPHIDYVTSYGPGRYWISALGLLLSDGGLLGELATRSICLVVYLVLLHRLLHRLGAGRVMTWLLLAAAAIALPPGHKYWTVLCPLLVLHAVHRGCFDASRRAAVGAGAAIGLAALFRPDYGLFALTAGLAMIASDGPTGGERRRRLAALFAGIALPLLPWLILVGLRKNLVSFLLDWMRVGSAVGSGMGLPHPLLHWYDLSLSAAFLFVVAVPLVGLLLWRLRPHPVPGLQRFAVAVHLFALVNLVQSSHRADWPHLLQGIAPAFVSLALVLLWPGAHARVLRLRLVLPLVFAALLFPGRNMTPASPATAIRNWSAAALPKAEFARRYLSDTPPGQLVRIARDCLAPDEPTAFYPFAPQLNFFAERPFAAGLPFLAPGFFATAEQQASSIATLEREKSALLFWAENAAYDGVAKRNSINTHARIHAAVSSRYTSSGNIARYTVFRRRGVPAFPAGCAQGLPVHL